MEQTGGNIIHLSFLLPFLQKHTSIIRKEVIMENITISKGMRLLDKIENINYRVLHVTTEYTILVNMDVLNRIELIMKGSEIIRDQLANQTMEVVSEPLDYALVNIDFLSESAKIKYQRNKLIVDLINTTYAPDYLGLMSRKNKPVIEEIIKRSNMSRAAVWRTIIKYLQSGCREYSLLRTNTKLSTKDNPTAHKRGRTSDVKECNGKNLTEKDKQNMNIYMNKYLSNQGKSARHCYYQLINDCYTDAITVDGNLVYKKFSSDQCPSFYQFRYYIREHSTKEKRREAKLGKRNFRNSERLLTGTALNGVFGPGDICEIDACELDIAVVSATNRKKTVGSPVVYFIIDVYSRLILGASISFDNNSILAMTNCLASLVEDKREILKSVGIQFQPTKSVLTLEDAMPSGIKPHVLRMDHGSDFISKQSQLIANELNIELQYVPPGTGSLKGIVERSFRSFQSYFTGETEKAGTKEHNNISKHNREAVLTIEDVKKIMYLFILAHNTTVKEGYDLTPDMVANKVGSVPAEIWRYGIQHAGNPAYITDVRQFLYSLLVPEKAALKRSGIHYQGLRYIPDLNEDTEIGDVMLSARGGSIPFNIRVDLRSTRYVYYMDKKGILHSAHMVKDTIHEALATLTWPQYLAHHKEASKLLRQKQVESDEMNMALYRTSLDVIDKAKALSGKGNADTKNMRETRALEKARVAKELSFDKKFGLGTVPAIAEPEPKSLPNKASFNAEPKSYTKEESPQVPVIRANKILNPESTDTLNPASVPKKRGRKPNSFKDIKKFAEPRVNPPKQKTVKTDSKAETKGNEADNMLPWKGNVIAEPAVKPAFSENLSDFQTKAAESQTNVSDFQDNAMEEQTSSMETEHILTEEERRKKVLQDIIDMCEEYEDGDY